MAAILNDFRNNPKIAIFSLKKKKKKNPEQVSAYKTYWSVPLPRPPPQKKKKKKKTYID